MSFDKTDMCQTYMSRKIRHVCLIESHETQKPRKRDPAKGSGRDIPEIFLTVGLFQHGKDVRNHLKPWNDGLTLQVSLDGHDELVRLLRRLPTR